MKDRIKVVNRSILSQNHSGKVFNIMRPYALGNPYRVTEDQPREVAVGLYRKWLWAKIQKKDRHVLSMLKDIKSAVIANKGTVYLMCCCKPASCHGDIVKNCIIWSLTKKGD